MAVLNGTDDLKAEAFVCVGYRRAEAEIEIFSQFYGSQKDAGKTLLLQVSLVCDTNS